ncbi:MFS transporter [Streptomyces apocyni]|uniref:MFS transporter n=1 Tax=Streptomyces apocyni TaxID=2654677 RepID=UPI0018CFFBFE|nr:MFS transporter [Streptomyces apocyni]
MTSLTKPAGKERSLIHDRDFRLFWGGDLISQLGAEMMLFALPLVMVSTLDASGTQIGLLEAFYTLPFFALPIFVGVWQERRARRPVMIVSDFLRGALVLTIPLAALVDRLSLAQIYVVAVLVGALTVVYDIAAKSYLPRFVPDASLGSANSKLTTDQALSATLGPGLGGWLAGLSSAASVIFLNAVGYFVSALALLRMRHREPAHEQVPAESRNLRRELAEGFAAVFKNPPVRAIALHATIYNMGGALVNVGFVVYFVRDQGLSQFSFGMVAVVGGIGAICGALGIPLLFDRIGYGKALLVALFFGTFAYFLLPAFTGSESAVHGASAVGFFFGFGGSAAGSVIAVTVRQKVTPPELHARMNATYRLMNFGSIPFGAVLGGVMVDGIGARETLWVAPLFLLASVLPVATRTMWTLRLN